MATVYNLIYTATIPVNGYNTVRRVTERRVCKRCGKDKTILSAGRYPMWYKTENVGEFYCHACHNVVTYVQTGISKRYYAKCNARRNPCLIWFLGKSIVLTFNPRKDICSKCGMQHKKTHMNHLLYVPIMPWACAEELCPGCHASYHYVNGEGMIGKRAKYKFESGPNNPMWKGGITIKQKINKKEKE